MIIPHAHTELITQQSTHLPMAIITKTRFYKEYSITTYSISLSIKRMSSRLRHSTELYGQLSTMYMECSSSIVAIRNEYK